MIPFLLLLFTINSVAKERSSHDLENVALNFSKMQMPNKKRQIVKPKIMSIKNSNQMYRIINLKPEGWVIVSKDDIAKPVLAYSSEGMLDTTKALSPSFKAWMKDINTEITKAKENHLDNDEYIDKWEELTLDEESFNERKIVLKGKSLEKGPLLGNINWNQNTPYNNMTPKDPESLYSYGGRVPVGCVATAIGQIMAYHKWPSRGKGSHTDTNSGYGNLYANFNTTYNWYNMSNYDLAKISYHLGIATDMMYGPDGSGTYSYKAVYALTTHFKYKTDPLKYRKSNQNMQQWHAKLKQNIDQRLPVYYTGGTDDKGYHAFVIDGYSYTGVKYYHINFGWGGYENGWYTIDATNSPFNFKDRQNMITGIKPSTIDINPPGNLRASKISANSVTLTWKDTSVGEDGYTVYKATGSNSFVFVARLPKNATSYTINNLASNTVYKYRIDVREPNSVFTKSALITFRTKKIPGLDWYTPIDFNLVY